MTNMWLPSLKTMQIIKKKIKDTNNIMREYEIVTKPNFLIAMKLTIGISLWAHTSNTRTCYKMGNWTFRVIPMYLISFDSICVLITNFMIWMFFPSCLLIRVGAMEGKKGGGGVVEFVCSGCSEEPTYIQRKCFPYWK